MTATSEPIAHATGFDGAGTKPGDLVELYGNDEHPLLRIPFTAVIDGRSYGGAGLSLVSAFAKGLAAPNLEGQQRIVTLRFNLGGYTINFPLQVRVETATSGTGLVALRFVDPTGPHLPQLRYILNAFIAGELVEIGGLLTASETGGQAKAAQPRAVRPPFGYRVKQAVNTLAVIAATLVLAVIVAKGAYDRFFVIKIDGVSFVSTEGMTLRAVSAGQVDFVNTAAKSGEPLLSIRSTSGDVITLSKPCDCRALNVQVEPGTTVLAGDPLMQLSKPDARPIVHTSLDPAAIEAVGRGAAIELEFADGRIASAKPDPIDSYVSSRAEFTLLPSSDVTAADIGKPVMVRVLADPGATLRRMLRSFGRIFDGLGIPGFSNRALG
ncbi:alginate biosynthesis protein Alg44 [soil metagenome]